jgi:hypothetical protein
MITMPLNSQNSHPIHLATMHFPIAYLVLANILNIIYSEMPIIYILKRIKALKAVCVALLVRVLIGWFVSL